MSEVAVVGGGAWGTALAIQAHRAGGRVTLWTRSGWGGRISPHLPGYVVPEGVALRTGVPDRAELVVLAVPVQHLRGVAAGLRGEAVLVCAKGVEAGSLRLPLEVLAEVLPGVPAAVLSGPNFAHEVAAGLPAASVIAAADAGCGRG